MLLPAICCIPGLIVGSCARPATAPLAEIHVAAASDLTRALAEINSEFEHRTRVHVTPAYGSAGQLTQQIQDGARYDVLLSEDTDHVDRLIASGVCRAESRAVYGRGHVVLWAPLRPDFRVLADVDGPSVLGVIVADPSVSPYGAAAIEAMKNLGLWEKLQTKNIAYAPDAATARRSVRHADAAFTALSLIADRAANYFLIDDTLHRPLDQALCITRQGYGDPARKFAAFLTSDAGYAILRRYGYGRP